MITAQTLYDRRELYEEIGGTDLHDILNALCGDPSPSGRTPIEEQTLADLADAYAQRYAAHKAVGGVGGEYLQDMALFLIGAATNCGDSLVGDRVRSALGAALLDARSSGGSEEPIRMLMRAAGDTFDDEDI